MPAVMQNAAQMAYRKAAEKTRDSMHGDDPDVPAWLSQFASQLPEDDSGVASSSLIEPTHHKKERVLKNSKNAYERFAWLVYEHITNTMWFESFILFNIILVGVTTGLDLENQGRDAWTVGFSDIVGVVTLSIFTLECVLKIIAEGLEPWVYFTDPDNRYFNTFDFVIVVASYVFMQSAGSAISGLRMLRLIRLLTFVKNVPELRIIVAGLIQGVKSVVYIVMLLFLVIYIFAILGCILFGNNDPAHFGDVAISMMSLFQVSTLASWTSIAYVSWFGCKDYLGSPYGDENPSRIHTMAGDFEGFKCTKNIPSPISTGIFFAFYILVTSWVIMSLFIGVISMGMFDSFFAMKEELSEIAYVKKLADNSMSEAEAKATGKVTLKEKIDRCLDDELPTRSINSNFGQIFDRFTELMIRIRDSDQFSLLITATILLVGCIIGVDTNYGMRCVRLKERLHGRDDDYSLDEIKDCEEQPLFLVVIGILSQTIFTIEAVVKIAAEGTHPLRYFTDRENGSWNCLDFFIVLVGFLELTPAAFIFKNFPVVLLRLCRLLRVFRLAKALPRLRSIVEALISGFSSVGWICILIAVFNYIVSCMCMIFFRENDAFHFGSLGRSMFTILRIETLDTWDQILYVAMFGCAKYPAGNSSNDFNVCPRNTSFGWIGAIVLFFVTIIGAYVLPIVLIGVVSIKFDEASKFLEIVKEEKTELARHLELAQATLPDFFTNERMVAITDVFHTLDSSGEYSLDMSEIAPFFHYTVDHLFGIEMTPDQCESLFYLLDSNHTTEIGMGEFVTFIAILKKMAKQSKEDPDFAKTAFGDDAKHVNKVRTQSAWDAAMQRVDKDSYDAAWDAVLRSINGAPGKTLKEKVVHLFKDFDSDNTGELDLSELAAGLESCGIRMNHRQTKAFVKSVDKDGDGNITFDEFVERTEMVKQERADLKEAALEKEQSSLLKRASLSKSGSFRARSSSAETEDFVDIQKLRDQVKDMTTEMEELQEKLNKLKNKKSGGVGGDSASGDIEMSDSNKKKSSSTPQVGIFGGFDFSFGSQNQDTTL